MIFQKSEEELPAHLGLVLWSLHVQRMDRTASQSTLVAAGEDCTTPGSLARVGCAHCCSHQRKESGSFCLWRWVHDHTPSRAQPLADPPPLQHFLKTICWKAECLHPPWEQATVWLCWLQAGHVALRAACRQKLSSHTQLLWWGKQCTRITPGFLLLAQ